MAKKKQEAKPAWQPMVHEPDGMVVVQLDGNMNPTMFFTRKWTWSNKISDAWVFVDTLQANQVLTELKKNAQLSQFYKMYQQFKTITLEPLP